MARCPPKFAMRGSTQHQIIYGSQKVQLITKTVQFKIMLDITLSRSGLGYIVYVVTIFFSILIKHPEFVVCNTILINI